jgi:hypothetical protein
MGNFDYNKSSNYNKPSHNNSYNTKTSYNKSNNKPNLNENNMSLNDLIKSFNNDKSYSNTLNIINYLNNALTNKASNIENIFNMRFLYDIIDILYDGLTDDNIDKNFYDYIKCFNSLVKIFNIVKFPIIQQSCIILKTLNKSHLFRTDIKIKDFMHFCISYFPNIIDKFNPVNIANTLWSFVQLEYLPNDDILYGLNQEIKNKLNYFKSNDII